MTSFAATARAHPNIALAKYWGKRDAALNIPAAGSVSMTLDTLATTTTVSFDTGLPADELILNGAAAPAQLPRISAFLDLVRRRTGMTYPARVESSNNFPTAAGLASSASGFAALALAATCAAGTRLTPRQLSQLARQGSGSAARSIFGGFVAMSAGENPDGTDAIAEQIAPPEHWPLAVVVAITSTAAKAVGSGPGMNATRDTSPYYAAWVETAERDAAAARAAIADKDFTRLADISEASCLAMHAVMLSARPGLIYFSGATIDALHLIRELRENHNRQVFFTVDAGPQIKAVCAPDDADAVAAALRDIPGVHSTMAAQLGPGAQLCTPSTSQ